MPFLHDCNFTNKTPFVYIDLFVVVVFAVVVVDVGVRNSSLVWWQKGEVWFWKNPWSPADFFSRMAKTLSKMVF